MTKKQFKHLTIKLYHAGFELILIEKAISDIVRAIGDKDWLIHVDELTGAIEITRQIVINIFLN